MRRVNNGLEGRYHNWDSYPSGLGEALYNLYYTYNRDLSLLCKVLIDEHPAGWSTIVNRDFSLEPGFITIPDKENQQPLCYCHGDHPEKAVLWTEKDLPADLEYVYTFDEGEILVIMDAHLRELARVSLRDAPPDWKALDKLV